MSRSPFRWVFVSDLQLTPETAEREDRRRLLIERVAAEKPHLVIDGGDHVAGAVNDDPEERHNVALMWEAYHRVMAPLRDLCPVIHSLGNHDQTGTQPSNDEFLRQVGRDGKSTYHATTIGGVHFVSLNVVAGRHRGGFSNRAQINWLRRDLRTPRRARCTVAVGHYPIVVADWLKEHSVLGDEEPGGRGLLLPMLLEAGVDLYLCGHLHVYQRSRVKSLTHVMASGSDSFFPEMREKPGEHSVAFDERQTYVRFVLEETAVRAEAVAADGDIVDQWTQKLNPKPTQRA